MSTYQHTSLPSLISWGECTRVHGWAHMSMSVGTSYLSSKPTTLQKSTGETHVQFSASGCCIHSASGVGMVVFACWKPHARIVLVSILAQRLEIHAMHAYVHGTYVWSLIGFVFSNYPVAELNDVYCVELLHELLRTRRNKKHNLILWLPVSLSLRCITSHPYWSSALTRGPTRCCSPSLTLCYHRLHLDNRARRRLLAPGPWPWRYCGHPRDLDRNTRLRSGLADRQCLPQQRITSWTLFAVE